jgi:UDP-glucose:(heptosyl)LPS alpha-1,3-glucosyltransferase
MRAGARLVRSLDISHWSYTLLERRQYCGPDTPLILVNSELVREHFRRHLPATADDIRVVRSAIDPERFAAADRLRLRAQWRQTWGIAADETVGLFVAMNYRLKGLEPLLYAVQLLSGRDRYRFLIVGSPRTGSYERMARRLGIADRICFVGPRRDVQNCYFASDFLVHPTFYDPCSLVALEALACGLPVITTRYNGASELLDSSGESFIVDDPHDHTQLSWCLTQMLNPQRRAACAQAARKAAARWTFTDHYRQLLNVLADAAVRKQVA